MQDQYGVKVPDDLVLLPNSEYLTDSEVKVIFGAEWYENRGILLVSGSEIDWLSEDDPLDAGLNLAEIETIDRVADPLKRFNRTDGFYHA